MTAQNIALTDLLAAVAAELGPEWTAALDSNGKHGTLTSTDGSKLNVSTWQSPAHAHIWGDYPEAGKHLCERHSINVGRSRGARAMAAEIRRRLLPVYLPELHKAQKRAEECAASARGRADVVGQLLAALPGTVEQTDDKGEPTGSINRDRWGWSFDVHYGGATVDVKLPDLRPEQAVALARLVAELGITTR